MKTKIAVLVGLAVFAIIRLDSTWAQNVSSGGPGPEARPPVTMSQATADLIRLAESGVTEEVLLAYVGNASGPYNLSADTIVYLRDEGISDAVMKAMLTHDSTALNPNAPPGGSTSQYIYDQRLYTPTTPAPPVPFQPAAQPQPSSPQPAAPSPVAPPTYVTDAPANVNYFYSDLSPYGTWMNVDGFGWCWQPSVALVNRQWQPYCDSGYWVDTSDGWCWQSGYTWGWAPFHYGRWHHHDRFGWVWFPDTVWGPGWVTWRTDSDYCGWAPLPFRAEFDVRTGFRFNGVGVAADFDFGLAPALFTFIAIGDFTRHDYVHHRLANVEVSRFYGRTKVLNNSIGDRDHLVVNRGIPRERVEEVTHTKIKTVEIRNAPQAHGVSRPAAAGVVYRRELTPPVAPVRVVAQKVDDRHPVVPHSVAVAPVIARPSSISPNSARSPYAPVNGARQPQAPQPTTAYRPAQPNFQPAASGSPSMNNGSEGSGNTLQTRRSQTQNGQVYQPKTYQQLNENRPAPTMTRPVPVAPASPSYSPQQPSNSGKGNPDKNQGR